ncbi:MAG: glycoside hydrolase family 3 C-terminal domain-containing protein, partial [Bacteroidales bacterium]|nr:glycoside hydrolase family 3 C-terminal domain-containing protein [Bacteroidales bacterium]
MKNKVLKLSVILAFGIFISCNQNSNKMKSNKIEMKVESILSMMTLEEKIDMIGGFEDFNIRPLERLGIPKIIMADGPVGVRNYGRSVAYPAAITVASSWNVDLAKQYGESLGCDAKNKNVHILLGPGMNIYRTPMCGRNFEYLGEDPYLAGKIAANIIKGIQSEGVIATAKHFVANNQEYDRHNVSSDVDERTLQEIYLGAFRRAVKEGNVGAVMTAYNLVNNIHCSEHEVLINQILKNEWGFDGIVMSDWVSTYSTVNAINAGLDLEMPSGLYLNRDSIMPAIEKGLVLESTIDDKIRRMLRYIIKFGYLEKPDISSNFHYNQQSSVSTALETAREGIVLLKNENNILPLDKNKLSSIAVIGPICHPAVTGGSGSSFVSPISKTSIYEGIKNLAGPNIEVLMNTGSFIIKEEYINNINAFSIGEKGKSIKGFKTEYFDNIKLEGEPILTRQEEFVNFDVDLKEMEEIPRENISVRWTGKIKVDKADKYRIFVSGDDGYRLFLNNKLIIDDWTFHAEKLASIDLYLEAENYDIKLEFFQGGGSGVIKFGYTNIAELEKEFSKVYDLADQSDIVIMCIGFNAHLEGEGFDRSFKLPKDQQELLNKILKLNKDVIVVLTGGGNVYMEDWLPKIKGLLHAWYPGQEGGTAIAEILFGEVNPSGKLPVSFEKRWEDNACFNNYYDIDKDKRVEYAEGIFMGYRHFDKNEIEPLFPFGYGLSYTTFEYSNLKLSN